MNEILSRGEFEAERGTLCPAYSDMLEATIEALAEVVQWAFEAVPVESPVPEEVRILHEKGWLGAPEPEEA